MNAGRGVTHSEYNHSKDAPVHFLQIWIRPAVQGSAPEYTQNLFPEAERRDRLRLVASPDGGDGSIRILQDARLYSTLLSPGATVEHHLETGRHAWAQVARGAVTLNGNRLEAGDGAAVSDEDLVRLTGEADGDVLLFDLA